MSKCPISVRPGQIIGHVNGRAVYAIAGASPDGDDAAAQAAAEAAAKAAADTAAADAAAKAAADAKGGEWDGKIESLPPAAQKLITDARAEAGKARTTAKEQAAQEAREELLKKLGLTKDGEQAPDPDALAAQLASREAELLNMRRERATETAALAQGVNVPRLMNLRSVEQGLKDLDPAADDFAAKVDALVKKELAADPTLKQAQAAGVSGGQFTGGSGEGKQRPTSLHGALSAAVNR